MILGVYSNVVICTMNLEGLMVYILGAFKELLAAKSLLGIDNSGVYFSTLICMWAFDNLCSTKVIILVNLKYLMPIFFHYFLDNILS